MCGGLCVYAWRRPLESGALAERRSVFLRSFNVMRAAWTMVWAQLRGAPAADEFRAGSGTRPRHAAISMNAAPRKWIGPIPGWWWPRVPFAILLFACGVWAYQPAMNRVFSGDQLGYFAELHGETSLRSGWRLLDYGVQRHYSKGDQLCYRPLLFAGLAVENAWFKRNLQAWNGANLGIHLAVAYLLFEMLWRIRRTALAGGLALWFALLASNFELATWSHLGGYMLGYGLLLLSLYASGKMEKDDASAGWFWIYGSAITCAMLEHEIAVVACLGVAVHGIWFSPRRKKGWQWLGFLGAPLVIYGMLYAAHVMRCDRLFWVGNSGGGMDADALADWPSLLLRWAQHILLPRRDQLAFMAGGRSAWLPWPGGTPPEVLASIALWAGFMVSVRNAWTWRRQSAIWPFGGFLIFLVVAYSGMNMAGRSGYVLEVPYYDYFPALFGAVWLYAHVDFSRLGRKGMMSAWACIVLLAGINGWQVYQIGRQSHELNRPWAHYLGWVESTVRPKLSQPGYSFAVRGVPEELNPEGELTVGYPDQNQIERVHVLSGLYGKSHDEVAPSEVLVYPGLEERARGAAASGAR